MLLTLHCISYCSQMLRFKEVTKNKQKSCISFLIYMIGCTWSACTSRVAVNQKILSYKEYIRMRWRWFLLQTDRNSGNKES